MDLSLYGPGDVLGIDPQLIVRTDPRPNSSDVEPNYLPAIEFDPPDLPWLFTPRSAGGNERLRPWLVLVCVDRSIVDPPQMTSSGGAAGASRDRADERSSGLGAAGSARVLSLGACSGGHRRGKRIGDSRDLEQQPNLNVSRLVCPRRLCPAAVMSSASFQRSMSACGEG